MRLPRKAILSLLVVLTVCGGAACSDDRGPTTAGVLEEEPDAYPGDIGQWVIEVEADPGGDLDFDVEEVVSPPGNANFVLRNPQSVGHDLSLETAGGKQLEKTQVLDNGIGWMRLTLEAGTKYVFYCSVPGHREAGMEGTLIIDEKAKPEGLFF